MEWSIKRLGPEQMDLLRSLNALFHTAFDNDPEYSDSPPDDAYLQRVLAHEDTLFIVAVANGEVIGGAVAYVLHKFEQARAEIYVYDLAVAEAHRRRGIATAVLNEIRRIASDVGAWIVYIQADQDDPPADTLYTKLGTREEVLHFDLTPLPRH